MAGGSGKSVERYELLGELATGGMATVYFARQRGALGFTRPVAVKSMHPQLAKDPNFRAMFLDEAQLTARIRHPNVVPTLDVVQSATKLLIVMEYVEGVSLSVLLRAAKRQQRHLPVRVVAAIARDLLEGLQAAHEAKDDHGDPLGVVHRDVSPQNVLIGVDGIARVADFGVAKAAGRSYQTQTGEVRGKVGYMAPEQMFGEDIDRRVDIYAAGVVLWEALVGGRLFSAPTDAALVLLVTRGMVAPPSVARGEPLPEGLDALVARALSHDPADRFATAADVLKRLSTIMEPASREEVGQLVRELAPDELALRAAFLRASTPDLDESVIDSEALAVLEVLTRATMARDAPSSAAMAPTAGKPRSRFGSLWAILAALAGIGIVVLTASVFERRRTPASVPTAIVAVTGSFATATASPAVSSTPDDAASVRLLEPSATATSSSTPMASNKSATGTVRKKSPAFARPDCVLPYTTDTDGNRHYKAECLERIR